jgi:hypothetical protein
MILVMTKTLPELQSELFELIRFQDMEKLKLELMKRYRVNAFHKLKLDQLSEYVDYLASQNVLTKK